MLLQHFKIKNHYNHTPLPTSTFLACPSLLVHFLTMSNFPVSKRTTCRPSRRHTPNNFLQTVRRIAECDGQDPNQIVPLFRHYTSAQFVYGPPTDWNHQIPEGIWQRVCDHFNAHNQAPYHRLNIVNVPTMFKEKSMVFINGKVTARLIRSQLIREDILTARRLYQYLNWTMRISKVAQTMTMMEGRNGGKVLLFDVELHDERGEGLYALCVPNDVMSPNAQQWQLADLLTGPQLTTLLGIDSRSLPRGVRMASSQFEQFRMMESEEDMDRLKTEIMAIDDRLNRLRYYRLKCIRTGNGKKSKKWADEESVLKVNLSTFYEKVQDALMDENVDLIPIVSIVSRRNKDLMEKEENFRYNPVHFVICQHHIFPVKFQ